MNETKGEYIL